MKETRTLVDYICSLRFDDLPENVVTQAKLCILDTIGVGLCASHRPWTNMVKDVATDISGVNEASLWGHDSKVPAQYAALVNGTSAHGIELSDRHPAAGSHCGSVTVPAAFASTELTHGSGRELITAVIAGYETQYRVGYAMKGIGHPGVHEAASRGVWGAVAASSVALNLDSEQTLNAFGIAGSMASGLYEFTHDPRGTMVKRLHGGWAAHNGLVAAKLAQKGLSGPCTVLEGTHGYCRTFSTDDPKFEELTRNLGESYKIMEREVKPYASWGGGHLAIEAAGALKADHHIDHGSIESIDIGGSNHLISLHESMKPESIMAAQYSLPFLTAVTLCRGIESLKNPHETWTDDILDDPSIHELLSKTNLFIDESLEEIYQREGTYGGARVIVTLSDGTNCANSVHHSKGMNQNPMTAEEIYAKFELISCPPLSSSSVAEVSDAISVLENVDDVREIGTLVLVQN